MPLPSLIRSQVEEIIAAYCTAKMSPEMYDHIRLGFKFRGNSVTLFQERQTFWEPKTWVSIVAAQFRYDATSKQWALYCADRNSRWHLYDLVEPNPSFEALLEVVDEDAIGAFWG